MLIVEIFGGLGNQMFQYAFARALSLEKGVPFAMDLSWFKTQIDTSALDRPDKREYLLDHFNIVDNYSSCESSSLSRLAGKAVVKIPILSRVVPLLDKRVTFEIKENGYEVDDVKIPSEGTVFLRGYWQNYEYFLGHVGVIARDFTLKGQMSVENRKYLEQIIASNSVSIHFRRGDSLKSYARKFYAMASIDYFLNAASLMGDKMPQPTFFVFSNDTEWVKANFKIGFPIVFIESGGPDYEHLFLMSRCKHNIIDSSTFSWWAAWLNENPSKIVVAPEKWVLDENNYHVKVPGSWLRFKN